jgi:adenosine kinase
MKSLKHADYLFCNELEAEAYSTAHSLETSDHKVIAKHIAMTEKTNQERPRIVIITDGPRPVICAKHMPGSEECEIQEYPVLSIDDTKIIDTNGAGDAFVGGFLAQLY